MALQGILLRRLLLMFYTWAQDTAVDDQGQYDAPATASAPVENFNGDTGNRENAHGSETDARDLTISPKVELAERSIPAVVLPCSSPRRPYAVEWKVRDGQTSR